jgi:hypothetical protein
VGDPREARDRQTRLTRRVVGCSAATLLAAPLGWVAAHHVGPAPEPLFVDSDLPDLPPTADNGCARIRPNVPAVDVPFEIFELVHAPMENDAADPPSWEAVLTEAERIESLVSDPATERDRAHAVDVFSAPRFVDSSAPRIERVVPALSILGLHRWVEAQVLASAIEGDLAGALALSTTLARADFDFLMTARSLVAWVVAVVDARRAVRLVELLVASGGVPPERVIPNVDRARDRLLEVLGGFERDAVAVDRAIVFEYLLGRHAIGAGTPTEIGFFGALTFDRRDTLVRLADAYAELGAYARDPSPPKPALVPPREATGWWLYNPTGKLLIDVLDPRRIADQLEILHAELDRLEAEVDRARRALRSE